MTVKRAKSGARKRPSRKPSNRRVPARRGPRPAPRSSARAVPPASAAREQALRRDLVQLLGGRGAHVTFEKAVAGLPFALQGAKPAGVPYTPWQQLEHLRLAQRDILDYVTDPQYVERDWPDDYWPTETPPTQSAWDDAVRAFEADRKKFVDLVRNRATDLLARVPHDAKGPTILHEALLVADHNAYHLGQLLVLRRALGAWTD